MTRAVDLSHLDGMCPRNGRDIRKERGLDWQCGALAVVQERARPAGAETGVGGRGGPICPGGSAGNSETWETANTVYGGEQSTWLYMPSNSRRRGEHMKERGRRRREPGGRVKRKT